MNVWVWGAGSSAFGKQPAESTASLVRLAVLEALRDAEVDQVDAVYVGTCFGEPGVAQRTLHRLGIAGLPITVLENACASSTHAFHEACAALEAGRHRQVLVVGVEHLTSRFTGALPVERRDHEGRAGLGLPALYAMSAAHYQDLFGLTDAELAAVSVKNHAHGVHNDRAQHRRAVTAEEVLASRMIADPLTLLQCCAISDGAAAVVVGDRRRGARDVPVLATAFGTGAAWGHDSPRVWGFDLVAQTAARAYQAAGVGIGDVDVLEVHDAFTIGEIVTLEALGMAPEGAGGRLALDGHTVLGGPQPVNPSGGLLSRGHPLGATGVAQIFEIVRQLRGQAGPRQVAGARIGLVETMGGGAGGVDGNACVVCLLGA
ncbi:thiolase family protein [Acrocarpospora catenulata]|uniref:thiolase family protein n=1 Tax=Acrocarpospora catenulata TaxID=2836182 RepID=UPI001BDA0B0A|nr:thiolase family protein [Acrocarpospora catenulata]